MQYCIPYLDQKPKLNAAYLVDSDLKRVGFEIAAILSNIHTSFGTVTEGAYKDIPTSYPESSILIWLINSKDSYEWLVELFQEILLEHEHRFNTAHVSASFPKEYLAFPDVLNKHHIDPFEPPPLMDVPRRFWRDHNCRPLQPNTLSISPLNSFRAWYKEEVVPNNNYTNPSIEPPTFLRTPQIGVTLTIIGAARVQTST